MKKKKIRENFFGTVDRTPGQNFIEALTEAGTVVGIPPEKLPQAVEIMKKALESDEVDIFVSGFGFFGRRVPQKEMAEARGIKSEKFSRMMPEIMEKLQKYPIKTQLMQLEPTLSQLFELAEKAEGMSTVALDDKLQSVQNQLSVCQDEKDQLETENLRLLYELESAQRMVKYAQPPKVKGLNQQVSTLTEQATVLTEQNKQLTKQVVSLNQQTADLIEQITTLTRQNKQLAEKVVRAEARAEAVKEAFNRSIDSFEESFGRSFEATKQIFVASITGAEINVHKSSGEKPFGDLDFPEEVLKALERAGIQNLDSLCKMTYNSLRRLIGGGNVITTIQRELKKGGLSLHTA